MSVIDEIVSSIDIVDYIENSTHLKKMGSNYRGCCPLHKGGNVTSFTVFNDNTFYCFACGKGGNIINFVMELENITYYEAIEKLAGIANIDISKDETYGFEKNLYDTNQRIADRCKNGISTITDYLKEKRGLNEQTINDFYLGYENNQNGKALVIPLFDVNNRIVAFCKRYLDTNVKAKYVNSKNNEIYVKGEYLFNINHVRKQLSKYGKLYICEGYIDAMTAYEQGHACVAYCGSELTKGQINQIKQLTKHISNFTIMYCPDNDDVGQSKLSRTWEKFNELAPKMDVRVVRLPDGIKDFNELHLSGNLIEKLPSEPIALSVIKQGLNKCSDKQQEYSVAIEKIKFVKNPLLKADIIAYLAERWQKSIADVKEITNIDVTNDEMLADFSSVDECIKAYIDMINAEGTGTGFESIDESVKLRETDVVFWAGYSGTYKTMCAVQIALHNAVRLKKKVLFFSLEMSKGAIYERMIASILKKDTREVEQMFKTKEYLPFLSKIKQALEDKIYIIDKSNLSIKDIEKYINIANTMIVKDGKIDVVIIDYFQYLNQVGYEESSEAAKYTKVIAKNCNVVLFILSQLNRTGDNFVKPSIKMLKGTGDLEASGDYIFLGYRPEFNPKLTFDEQMAVKNHLVIVCGKGRRGAESTEFELYYDTTTNSIRDICHKE